MEVLDVEGVGRVEVAVEEVEVGRLQARLDVVVPDVAAFGDRKSGTISKVHKPIWRKSQSQAQLGRSEGYFVKLPNGNTFKSPFSARK